MPWFTIPIALAVAGGTTAATSVYAAKKQAGASEKATMGQLATVDKDIELQRENETRRREEFDRTEAENKRRFDEALAEERRRWEAGQSLAVGDRAFRDRSYADTRADRAPYVRAGAASIAKLQEMAAQSGITLRPVGEGMPAELPRRTLPTGNMGRVA